MKWANVKCCGEQSLIIQICTRDGAKRARCSISFISACVCNRSGRWEHFMCSSTMMKKGYFRNFEIEDNGKSLSTFVMQLSAPPSFSAQKNEMWKFHFPFHSSFLPSNSNVLVNGNSDDYEVKMLFESRKFSLFNISTLAIRSLNCLSVKICLSFIFLITDNMLHYYIQKVNIQLSLQQSLNWLSVKTCPYKKIYSKSNVLLNRQQ